MDEIAANARRLGLNWASSRVGAIENGRFKPSVDTLAALALALADDTGRGVSVSELLSGVESVSLSPSVSIPSGDLLRWLAGGPLSPAPGAVGPSVTPGEERIARAAGISAVAVRDTAMRLWGVPFEARRDSIAGPGASPQKKGQVSRALLAEVVSHVTGGGRD